MPLRKVSPARRVARLQQTREQRRRVIVPPPHESKRDRLARIVAAQNPGRTGGRR